ncbi:hypothetical protein D3C84_351080 [compost metagenome]
MPAANIMENQDRVLNSGLASLPPRRIRPSGEIATPAQNSTARLPMIMMNQSRFCRIQPFTPSRFCAKASGLPSASATMTITMASEAGNITRWKLKPIRRILLAGIYASPPADCS